MRKKIFIVIILLTVIILTSCNLKTQDNDRIKSPVTDKVVSTLPNKEQLEKDETQILKEKNQELGNKLNEYKKTIDDLKSKLNNPRNYEEIFLNTLKEDYPWMEKFITLQQPETERWNRIIIYKKDNPEGKVTIDNPKIIQAFAPMFYVNEDVTDYYPNGVQENNGAYVYEAISGSDKLVFYVWNNETIEFEKLPMRFFKVGRGIEQLGNAFLPKPKYYVEGNVLLKMLNSGLMLGEKENPFYFTQPFRMGQIVYGFMGLPKKEINKPDVSQEQITERLTFYYYGEKIYIVFYGNYIQIIDGSKEYWYQMDKKDILALVHYLSAG